MRSYQVLLLLNRILNSEDEKIWIGFHHAALLGVPVICFFVSIRWTNAVSTFTVCSMILVGTAGVLIMYFEVLLCCILPDKAAKFLKVMRRKNTRKPILGRQVRTCKLIQ